MVAQKYRWDFIGLSTDTKPTAETSEKVVNGSTYYCSDTSKLYVYCNGTWYERKPLGGGDGGTSNFNDLSNRPKYNGSDMTGSTNIPEVKTYTAGSNVAISDQNVISATDTTYTAGTNVSISDQNVISATDTTYSNFTGTDGTAAGAAGLVPAPATTDAGKFLKADGTWGTAGSSGGGIIELTSADYNYPTTGTPTSVALWLLSDGVYVVTESINVYHYADSQTTYTAGTIVQIKSGSSGNVRVQSLYPLGSIEWKNINATTGVLISSKTYLTSYDVQQSTGTSTTNVMSQNAVTSMVYADPSVGKKVRIGASASTSTNSAASAVALGARSNATADNSIAIGSAANSGTRTNATGQGSIALGNTTTASAKGSIALGFGSSAASVGELNIGSSDTGYGYNSSNYRLLTGLYDPQSAHDAATKGYVDATTDSSAPTTATVGRLGQIQIDTTNNDAYMCVAVDDVTPAYTWKKITV